MSRETATTSGCRCLRTQGRSIVMAVQPNDLDLWTGTYYEKIASGVRNTNFTRLSSFLSTNPNSKAVLDSDKPRADLMAPLYEERLRLFRSAPTKAGVAEIQRINALLNALRYRDS